MTINIDKRNKNFKPFKASIKKDNEVFLIEYYKISTNDLEDFMVDMLERNPNFMMQELTVCDDIIEAIVQHDLTYLDSLSSKVIFLD